MKLIKYVILLSILLACTTTRITKERSMLIGLVITKPEPTFKGWHFKTVPQTVVITTNGKWYLHPIEIKDTIDTYIEGNRGKYYQVGKTYYFSY